MPDNFLEHYGMKGMKWGIRKARKASKTKSAKETAKTLTNKELKKELTDLTWRNNMLRCRIRETKPLCQGVKRSRLKY